MSVDINIDTILGAIGSLTGIIAIFLVIILRGFDREQIVKATETRLETFNRTAREHLDLASNISKEIQESRSAAQSLRPDLSMFLATQWRFIEKIFRYRYEKHSIARKIATRYVDDNRKLILLDSGSTTDLITSELLVCPINNVHVYSNNVFAAMHLVGTDEVTFHLFQGRFSERFAAVYSAEANNRIDQLGINLFILAAVALRFSTGIMVHDDDEDNYMFKQEALKAFMKAPESQLLIAVDTSKFFEPTDRHRGVVSPDEWKDIISKAASRIVVVTSPPAPDFDVTQRAQVETEIASFRRAGIKVDNNP